MKLEREKERSYKASLAVYIIINKVWSQTTPRPPPPHPTHYKHEHKLTQGSADVLVARMCLVNNDGTTKGGVASRWAVNARVIVKEPVEVGTKLCLVGTVSILCASLACVTGVILPLWVKALSTILISHNATAIALWSNPLKVGIQPQHSRLCYLGPE